LSPNGFFHLPATRKKKNEFNYAKFDNRVLADEQLERIILDTNSNPE
jgi:hypothetical protein